MAVPLYVAEAAPAAHRGALVSVNVLMITSGQLASYLVNLAFTTVPGTWRWMLGVSAAPAIVQLVLMAALPESPKWLFKQGRSQEARVVLQSLRTAGEAEAEMHELEEAEKVERAKRTAGEAPRLRDLVATREMRLALTAGVGLQVFQQLVGINTVMYYSPSIVELAGYAAHRTALLLSIVVASMNALGTVAGIVLVDRCGRRKLVTWSLYGVVVALAVLAAGFQLAALHSPAAASGAPTADLACAWEAKTCTGCLQHHCGFCAAHDDEMLPGMCMVQNSTSEAVCVQAQGGHWYTQGCPSRYGWLALVGLTLYIAAFAPGMGPVPWAVNAEIYPLRLRGMAGGVAATANWVSNLLIAQSFLSIVHVIGTSATFSLFAGIALVAIVFVWAYVPETKGLSAPEVDAMWERRAGHKRERQGRPRESTSKL
eukprot:SM000147S01123  [mRNA]  locus=s147:254042:256127:+ [translate_table: standard]